MTEPKLSEAVRAVIEDWSRGKAIADQQVELGNPHVLGQHLGAEITDRMVATGHTQDELRALITRSPFCHLRGVFDPSSLPDTPTEFFPVPDTQSTSLARAAALGVHCAMGMETISYRTENEGNLFVNLVVIPGKGRLSEKSQGGMRGHTDAVSFPFNGDDDPDNARIAPSPDVVTLIGLRNPRMVPTKIMPLDEILTNLTDVDLSTLQEERFSIRPQRTFVQGMKRHLGNEHVVQSASILKQLNEGHPLIRYSHSSVVPQKDEDKAAVQARNSLELACRLACKEIIIQSGDVLIVNNRLCLHGRGEVGTDTGGNSRWLLRTYGLNTSCLSDSKRLNNGKDPRHVLYP